MSLNHKTEMIPMVIVAFGEPFISLWKGFPPFVPRKLFCERTAIYSPHTMANLDCKKQGPSGKCRVGNKTCYERTSAVVWYHSRVKPIEGSK